uniref:Uncharacterized protein n=1 Tax=Anopheles culicifacies TaxID=139723 RepID=A0A182MG88_9DIPT
MHTCLTPKPHLPILMLGSHGKRILSGQARREGKKIDRMTDIFKFRPYDGFAVQTYQNTSSKTVTETRATNGYNGSLPRSTTPHNSLPRSSTPQKMQTSASGNLSELDSLLQDLSSARYGNVGEKQPNNAIVTSPSPYAINDSIKRPSVDSLLEELSNAHSNPIYAVPHGNQNANQPGRQVTITVRETTTEKLTGTPSAQYQNQLYQQQLVQNESHTSSATKELDDLMASLSDFKIYDTTVKTTFATSQRTANAKHSANYYGY